jgi:uncharacterized protein
VALKVTLFVVVAVLILGIAFGFYRSIAPATQPMDPRSITSVTIGTTTIAVEVADTPDLREQGLSGRSSLAAGSGMLFVFDSPGNYGFWMKNMLFNLDMLFIDSSGTVVTVDQNLSPESYRQSPPQVFYPRLPASYVLEVPAGFAAAHEITEGMHAAFQ